MTRKDFSGKLAKIGRKWESQLGMECICGENLPGRRKSKSRGFEVGGGVGGGGSKHEERQVGNGLGF